MIVGVADRDPADGLVVAVRSQTDPSHDLASDVAPLFVGEQDSNGRVAALRAPGR
jgi:hypothetical protein